MPKRTPSISPEIRAGLARHKAEKANPAYQEWLSKLKAASKRIGDTAAARLTWLCAFARENLETADRVELGECLVAFGHGGFPAFLVGGVDLPPPLADEDLDRLHKEVRGLLRKLVGEPAGQAVEVPFVEGARPHLVRATNVGDQPAIFGLTWSQQTVYSAVFTELLEIVNRHGDRLRACDECGGPFVRIRRQQYCSRACSQRRRSARWYERHGEEARQRRKDDYQRKVAPARVRRRKRGG